MSEDYYLDDEGRALCPTCLGTGYGTFSFWKQSMPKCERCHGSGYINLYSSEDESPLLPTDDLYDDDPRSSFTD